MSSTDLFSVVTQHVSSIHSFACNGNTWMMALKKALKVGQVTFIHQTKQSKAVTSQTCEKENKLNWRLKKKSPNISILNFFGQLSSDPD